MAKTPYHQGVEAFEQGSPITDNPYNDNPQPALRAGWASGWNDASYEKQIDPALGAVEKLDSTGRKPDPIDVHVGSRVRLRRMVLGISQERLGAHMGLTFQQIQKYEKGTNRVGASRLWQLAKILDVPVGFFFEDVPVSLSRQLSTAVFDEPKTEAFLLDFLQSRDGLELNRAFVKITNTKVRKRIVELVRAFVGEGDAQPATLSALAREEAA